MELLLTDATLPDDLAAYGFPMCGITLRCLGRAYQGADARGFSWPERLGRLEDRALLALILLSPYLENLLPIPQTILGITKQGLLTAVYNRDNYCHLVFHLWMLQRVPGLPLLMTVLPQPEQTGDAAAVADEMTEQQQELNTDQQRYRGLSQLKPFSTNWTLHALQTVSALTAEAPPGTALDAHEVQLEESSDSKDESNTALREGDSSTTKDV
jgi:hypothetical protein